MDAGLNFDSESYCSISILGAQIYTSNTWTFERLYGPIILEYEKRGIDLD